MAGSSTIMVFLVVTVSHIQYTLIRAGLELLIFLPSSPKYWAYRSAAPLGFLTYPLVIPHHGDWSVSTLSYSASGGNVCVSYRASGGNVCPGLLRNATNGIHTEDVSATTWPSLCLPSQLLDSLFISSVPQTLHSSASTSTLGNNTLRSLLFKTDKC